MHHYDRVLTPEEKLDLAGWPRFYLKEPTRARRWLDTLHDFRVLAAAKLRVLVYAVAKTERPKPYCFSDYSIPRSGPPKFEGKPLT